MKSLKRPMKKILSIFLATVLMTGSFTFGGFANAENGGDPAAVIQINPANNWFKVDPNNTVMKTPADFAIGKMGTYEFALGFKFSLGEIPDDKRVGVAATFKIPAGFSVIKLPNLPDATFQTANNADGSTTVICKPAQGFTTALLGQISVRQNATKLLNELTATQGKYDFEMRIFTNYGKPEQEEASTSATPGEPAGKISLVGDMTTPEWTIVNLTDDKTWNTGDISTEGGSHLPRAQVDWRTASAADDAKGTMSSFWTEGQMDKKSLQVAFTKTKGHLLNDTVLGMILPGVGNIFEKDSGPIRVTFTADTGETVVMDGSGGKPRKSEFTINGAALAGREWGNNFAPAAQGLNLSWADLLYKAGTFTLEYKPVVYYNRLYQGDWSQTTHIAPNPSYVSYKATDGSLKKKEGMPLKFKYVQGNETISVNGSDAVALSKSYSNPLTQIAQYMKSGDKYNDSQSLWVLQDFKVNQSFKIMDDLKLSLEYEETLTPIELSQLRTSKQYGFTYRIFITDASTGNVKRIETLVDEESFAKGYEAQTIGGVTEAPVNAAAMTEWKLAEANDAGNKLYVSKIEVLKKEYEYNTVGVNEEWFRYRLRAYHHRLSNGADIPDKYQAKIKRELTSKQIHEQEGGPFKKEYTVTTLHQKDNIHLVADPSGSGEMEVNDHDITGMYRTFAIRKFSDTMKYNVDSNGNTIAFGEAGYDPVVVELTGDAITMADRLDRKNQRLLEVIGPDGVRHNLKNEGIDSEKYLIDASYRYEAGKETVSNNTNHNDYNAGFSGKLYKLDELCKALNIPYAKTLVVAVDEINDWTVTNQSVDVRSGLYIHKLMPGHMNYNGLIGTGGAADLPKTFKLKAALYCEYSDYKDEVIDGLPAHDDNGDTAYHGTKKAQTYIGAKFVEGTRPQKISVVDQDYYVNPFGSVNDGRGRVLGDAAGVPLERRTANMFAQDGVPSTNLPGLLELTRIDITPRTGTFTETPAMQYKDAVLDFQGTDKKLLSLTNAVSFDKIGWSQVNDFVLEYTLSTGETIKKQFVGVQDWQHPSDGKGRSYFLIPGVDVDNGIYLTSLKVSFPNDINWGANSTKFWNMGSENAWMPSIGLGMYNAKIPSVYPGTNIQVGAVSDKENDDSYDKLNVAAALSFKNLFEESKTEGKAEYKAEGASNRLAKQQIKIHKFQAHGPSVGPGTINQGENLNITAPVYWEATGDTKGLLVNNDVRLRPTYYYKINSEFSYINGSAGLGNYGQDENISVQFIPSGIGAGKSGSDEYGILKISYRDTPFEKLLSANSTKPGYSTSYNHSRIMFKLQAKYNAKPVVAWPLTGAWMDTDFDANRDGSGGNEAKIIVETTNDNNQLLDGAPKGDVFGNDASAKDINGDGKAEMLYYDFTKLSTMSVKINEQAIQGVAPYAIATSPYDESTVSVSSRDITAVENLFSERIFMTGSDAIQTKDWEVYVPIMKKGVPQKYFYNGQLRSTEKNDFSVDFMGIDTAGLDSKPLKYNLYYTTDANAAANGFTGAQASSWKLFKTNSGAAVENLPVDLAEITMIKLTIDKISAKEKISLDMQYKLHEHKSEIGLQTAQNVFYANFTIEGTTTPYFGDRGQSGKPLEYNLQDMEITGFAWHEEDYNSTYNDGTDTKSSGVEMKLFDMSGNEVKQTNAKEYAANTKFKTDADGKYTLVMPHDGKWQVKGVLPAGQKFVKQKVNGKPAIDSAFNRETNMAEVIFAANVARRDYRAKDVNAGLHTLPVIKITPDKTFVHVTDNHTGKVVATVENRVPNSKASLTIKLGEPLDIATIHDLGDESADLDGLKTGTVKGTAAIIDGYGDKVSQDFDIVVYSNVKYDSNTGTGTVEDTNRYYPSVDALGADANTDQVTVKPGTGLTKAGYVFNGWNDKADGTGTSYTAGSNLKTGQRTEDLILYAQWKPLGANIIFDKNTQSNNGEPLSGTPTGNMPNQPIIQDVTVQLTSNTYALEGYDFTGWNLKADGTGTAYADQASVKNINNPGEDVTLYAQWKHHVYTIKFDKNTLDSDGNPLISQPEGTTPDKAMVYGKADKLSSNGYTLTGYAFAGWSFVDDNGDIHTYTDEEEVKNLTSVDGGAVTLKAIWKKNQHTVTYTYTADVTGQPALPAITTHSYNDEVTVESNPVLPGYTFSGWRIKTPAGLTITAGKFTMPTEDVVLEGTWSTIPPVPTPPSGGGTSFIPVTSDPPVKKEIVGIENSRETFRFVLEAESNTAGLLQMPMPAGAGSAQAMEVTIKGTGSKEFGNITFTKPGTYIYRIKEIDTGIEKYSFDKSLYKIEYVVTANGVQLQVERKITKDGAAATDVVFINKYVPLLVKGKKLVVAKNIEGDKPKADSKFVFKLEPLDKNNPMPEAGREVTIKGEGEIAFGTIEFTQPGTYYYRIMEQNTGIEGYKYDKTVYMAAYVVKEENGDLKATCTIKKGKETVKTMTFTNVYKTKKIGEIAPKTGYDAYLILWMLIMITSLMLAIMLILFPIGKKTTG